MAAMEFAGRARELYEEKQRCPADDIMSIWTDGRDRRRARRLDP